MEINVHGDRIYVVLDEMKKTKTILGRGGVPVEIALPENHSERSRIGTIKKCGEEVRHSFIGDRVLLSTYAGVRIHLIDQAVDGVPMDEDRHRIIREEEIVATITD